MAVTSVYFIDFNGNEFDSLEPTFRVYRESISGIAMAQPAIVNCGDGWYAFDSSPTTQLQFIIDGGEIIGDPRIRYVRGVIEPSLSSMPTKIEEILAIVRDDMLYSTENGETFQTVYRNDAPFRKWQITDQLDRPVSWPTTSRLPVNRRRVL